MKLSKLNPKALIGIAFEFLIAVVVVAYLGLNSFRFWEWTFPPNQWYFAWLGFGLTGGAAIGYLVIFLWRAKTGLRKTIALVMLLVCVVGELATAGFGIQVEVWKRAGYTLTQEDFDVMTLVVQLLGFVHAIAILAYYAGDQIAEMFGDEDGDGTPNYRDNDYKSNKRSENRPQQQQAYSPPKSTGNNAPNQGQGTQYTLPAFLSASGMNTEQAFGEFLDETETFTMAWKVLRDGSSQDGYKQPPGITHSNFNDLAGKVRANGNFTNAAPSNSNHRR